MNGGKLPEQTDAGAEILQAQEEARVSAGSGKPLMLSDAAEAQRRADLKAAYGEKYKLGLRMNVAVGLNAILAAFAGRDADSVTLEEYIEHRDKRLAELPEDVNYFTFSWDAKEFVGKLFPRTQSIVKELFKDRYDVKLAEVKAKVVEIEKPRAFSMEAELERQADFEKAKNISGNEAKRMTQAVGFRAVRETFDNEAENSVTVERYREWKDSRLSNLPAEANYYRFNKEALAFINSQKLSLQEKLKEAFVGETDVKLAEVQDELMLLNAEEAIRYEKRRKPGLKIDDEGLVQTCVTDHDEPVRFVAMVWMENGQETGNFFRTGKDEVMKVACNECREIGAANGVSFTSYAGATRKMKSAKSAGATFADAVKVQQLNHGQHGGDQRRNDDRPYISEERKRKASRNLFAFEDGDPGGYLVIPPNWEVGKEGERKVVDTWILIESKGFNFVKILGAGPGFGKHVGAFFSRTDLPPAIFAAIKKDQAKQQG